MISEYQTIPTPALLIDRPALNRNVERVQRLADQNGVRLRPHTKTHKMPELAQMQMNAGAAGIAVAKTAEAEIMADNGLTDIFVANEPVGADKLARLSRLSSRVRLSFGVDCVEHLEAAEAAFAESESPANVLAEVEVGENRSGVIEKEGMRALSRYARGCKHVRLLGVFSHDGHSYRAADAEEARRIGERAQRRTLDMAAVMEEEGIFPAVVSVGSTTSVLLGCKILPGVTEIRIGTYVFMDLSQADAVGADISECCAASVLLTAISKPSGERVVFDGGAKALTMQKRTQGITANKGLGLIKGSGGVCLAGMYDEHSIALDKALNRSLRIGDKVEIIPNHICPCVNLFRKAYLVENGQTIKTIPILCANAIE